MRSAVALALLTFTSVGVAEAHIHLLQPMARQTDALGDPQKEMNCGSAALTRTTNRVSTYAPGATITVMWSETINHTGWYRIAFQADGENFHLPPGGPNGGFPDVDQTGMIDNTTSTHVLRDMVADGTSQIDVTLPNIECTNCTLQLIQVMTNGGPPYDVSNLYFNCADLVLAANAPDAGTQVTDPDAGVDPGTGPRSGSETGGCSAGGSSGAGLLALLGLVGFRRRRRS